MRNAIFCAAAISLAVVFTDQVVASGISSDKPLMNVDRTIKGDRENTPGQQTIQTPNTGERGTRSIPEGCEAAVSPLAKSASQSPARCLA